MNQSWVLRTGRLLLTPVAYPDLPDLVALKADPQVFAVMLGGVRTPERAAEELAEDIMFWGANGVGMWAIREAASARFLGITGLHARPEGGDPALRFALVASAHGRGFASEAAGAALRFAHERGRLARVIAVARATNLASRQVLGAIGMTEYGAYLRDGEDVLVYESVRPPHPA